MRNAPFLLVGLAIACLFVVPTTTSAQDVANGKSEAVIAFETLCKGIQQQPGSATEAQVAEVLDKAAELGRPFAAAQVLRSYLAVYPKPALPLRKKAIDNAMTAGDYNTAMARCKAYLKDARPGNEASQVAATLYRIQLDLLGVTDDAYRSMNGQMGALCRGRDARKFDSWYLPQARHRQDWVNLARRLAEIHASGLPPLQTQYLFWQEVDALLEGLRRPSQENFAAAVQLKRLAGAIRNDDRTRLRCALFAANLEYAALGDGKDQAQRDREFAPVLAAANAYLANSPTADTLYDVMSLFGGSDFGRFFRVENQGKLKREFFVTALARLPEQQRKDIFNRQHVPTFADTAQWMELAAKYPTALRGCRKLDQFPFDMRSRDPGAYGRLARVFEGSQSERAVIVRTLAANHDFHACVARLVQQESWNMDGYERVYVVLSQQMWPSYEALARDEDNALPADYFDQVLVRFGDQYVIKTPLALDSWTTREYLLRKWRSARTSAQEMPKMVTALDALAWVPFTENRRKDALDQVYNEFKSWTDQARQDYANLGKEQTAAETRVKDAQKKLDELKTQRAAAAAEKKDTKPLDQQLTGQQQTLQNENKALADLRTRIGALEKQLAQISPVESAFQRRFGARSGDPNRAPNPMCKELARARIAVQKGDSRTFIDAARKLYPMVRDYDTRKTLLGKHILRFLVAPSQDLDVFDFQLEALADQLRTLNPNSAASSQRVRIVADAVASSRPSWNWGQIPVAEKDKSLKLNAVFAQVLNTQIDRGRILPWLFDAVRNTRQGNGWGTTAEERLLNQELIEKMIQKKTLATTDWRPHGVFATTNYVALIKTEFPGLHEKYPRDTYFDDMMLEEATRAGFVDDRYFEHGGQDPEKKIRNLAAKLVSESPSLPVDGREPRRVYSQGQFLAMQSRAMGADPDVRDAMLARIESYYGKTRFDHVAMGRSYFDLVGNLREPDVRKEFFTRLSAYLDRATTAPTPLVAPNMARLPELVEPLTDQEVNVLLRFFTPQIRPQRPQHTLALRLVPALVAAGRERELFALAPYLWKTAEGNDAVQRMLVDLVSDLQHRDQYDLEAVVSGVGLDLSEARLRESNRNRLRFARAQALNQVGGLLPVDRSDPHYPILAAQADFLSGNIERVWQNYVQNRQLAVTAVKQLEPAFCVWLIGRNTELREFDAAEELAREGLQWMESQPDHFSPEDRARLLLAYADIALARPEYPRARALFGRIAAAEEFAGTRAQTEAELKIAEVDRATKHYGEAIERLERLLRRKDRFSQCEGRYHLARVLFDQEQYVEALAEVEKVFAHDPTHANARIFEGKINLQIKRLERASRIKVGFSTDQEYIVPGKPLRIGLRDQTLAVAGDTMAIEMRVWADSGDEEIFSLVPFADSRTEFEGQIFTRLGPVEKGDHTLQLLGNDRVHYDFSEGFKKAHHIEADVDHSLAVISDSELYASSGKILTKAEMEERALERMLRARLQMQQQQKEIALGEYRPHDQIKPGNPINVRVTDADRCITDQLDTVAVELSTTSGDRVSFDLTGSETHSDMFEGAVPTASASATAFASDSNEGSLPVFAISAGDHPEWVARADNKRPKTFSVDLNASEKLGTMKIDASVPGRKLKQFLLQASSDGKEFETIGSWPSAEQVWNGSPRLVQMSATDLIGTSLAEMRQALSIAPPDRKTIKTVELPAARWGTSGAEIAHVQAAFHLPTRRMTTLQVQPRTEKGSAQYMVFVDGRQARVLPAQTTGEDEDATAEPTIEFKGALGQGVHRIDVFVRTAGNATVGFDLLHDIDRPPYLEPCPAEMFDPEQHPMIAKRFEQRTAQITAAEDGGSFDVTFGPEVRARVVRLLIADFETDAPAIKKVYLTAQDERELLPSKVDLLALRTNKTLEIVPGDKISVVYRDPRFISKEKRVREAFLSATYANGKIDAALLTGYQTDAEGMRQPTYIGLRRFKPEDVVCVVVTDADADTSDKLDTVNFTARTGDGEPIELAALETEEHSGVFVGKIFVVEREPQRKSEIQVAEGEDLIFAYLDQENTDPGIPWERTAAIESVVYVEPEFRVFNTVSTPLPKEEIAAQQAGQGSGEFVAAIRSLAAVRSDAAEGTDEAAAVMGVSLIAELVWPTIVQTTASTAEIYVQTSTGRKAYGKEPKGEFDVNVPGTIRIVRTPSNSAGGAAPPGYRGFVVVGDPNAMNAMDDGRFMFSVPMRLAAIPEQSFATDEASEAATAEEKGALVVRGDDDIFIGFKYTNDKDETKWITRTAKVTSDAFFNVMDRQYRENVPGVYVGDSAYFRVIYPAMDRTDGRDKVTVQLATASGDERKLQLTETFEHSGVFKGPVKFVYADSDEPAETYGAVGVTYGEMVTASYVPSAEAEPLACSIEVFKGSDGDVQPFTKRFEDPLTAVRTRLTIAESYFELAKKHRRMGQDELTEQEIATGKRLLEEALRDYPDTEARAQVDYLLANLSLEFAEEADGKEVQKKHYTEALSRFAAIVSTYRDSPYAPKAQYKKALTLEKMDQMDRACEEYVKLSYRWPDDPLIAETIARLGQYFVRKGKELSAQAKEMEDPLQAEKARMESTEHFVTAGKVFGRLAVRFPTHRLADKTTAVSAQCFLRAKEYEEAIKVFRKVIDNDKADKQLRAESMYWAADCYMRQAAVKETDKNLLAAYRLFKDLTWDIPESKWARYARGRLAGEQLAAYDTASKDE